MQCNTSRRSYITSSQNWNNFLTEVFSPNTFLRLARTRQHLRVLLYRQQYDVLNNEGFVTGSTRRRFSVVHEEAVSEARVTDAEWTQNNLFYTAHVESSNPRLGTVLHDPSKCRSTYTHKPLLLISLWH